MDILIRYEKQGGHYHLKVFTSHETDKPFAGVGELVIDEKDFEALRDEEVSIGLIEKDDNYNFHGFQVRTKKSDRLLSINDRG
jgi:hypothetical protein